MTRRARELSLVGLLWFVCLLALTLLLTACGREATAPALECTPVAVSAADSIPSSLIPSVVVCVEAR